jgi:hypothetical protein
MKAQIVRSVRLESARGEAQLIAGDDRLWVRVSDGHGLLGFWSTESEGPGVTDARHVIDAAIRGLSAFEAWRVIDSLCFTGWEYWPGRPRPLSRYLDHDFDEQLAVTPTEVVGDLSQ